MKIAFFEIKDGERAFFESKLKGYELFFSEKTIQDALIKSENYEVISVFIHSRISDKVLDKLPKLCYLQTRSTGFEHLECIELYQRSLIVSNVAGYAGPPVAEFAFSLLLTAIRKTHIVLQRSKDDNFNYLDLQGTELFGKTIGILGLGTIGLQIAKIAKGFGMDILGYSRTKKPIFDTLGITFTSLEEVMKKADMLMLALSLTPATQNIIHEKNVLLLKKECIIINIARYEIMEKSLYQTLSNTIACDVDSDILLSQKENILHTPHMAYYTKEALERIQQISLENMKQFLSGETPTNSLELACKKDYIETQD